MKNSLLFLALMCFSFMGLKAQRVALTFNVSSFNLDRISSAGTTIDYKGSTTLTGNLRILSKKKWALRLGAGVDNLQYTVSDGVNTNYSAVRQDLKGILGVEKHFMIGNKLDLYPGLFIPVTVVGDNLIQENYDNIVGGSVRPGMGVLLGANIKVLKIFRVGVEFDASYDRFKEAVWESAQTRSFVPVAGLNHSTAFTIGVAF
ncbi:MAG: hypothetical protein MRZ79_13145 [Bacteroidia bacterium]|nr:hypothetical protein [Bacteroidia bacterium]